jgi:catechol 2,3-dioxygenase-like lactoylglutathione lyase family enzyme
MPVAGIDHVALPTADGERLLAFYLALGFTATDAEAWRAGRYPIFSIACGDNKINVHPEGFTANLRGPTAVPGCGDLCFVWEGGLESLQKTLADAGAAVIHGPVDRVGGRAGGSGEGVSVYTRDPDDNLVEFICYDEPAVGRVS